MQIHLASTGTNLQFVIPLVISLAILCFNNKSCLESSTMSNSKSSNATTTAPAVTRDPRFKAGCKLVQKGLASHGAVEIFESLAEEAGIKYGESSIEAAPAYYEYGNALLRAMNRRKMEEEQDQQNTASPHEAAAAAAEQRLETSKDADNDPKESPPDATKTGDSPDDDEKDDKEVTADEDEPSNDEEDDEAKLALEMMENSFSIMEEYRNNVKETEYQAWVKQSLPRVLLGIGDTLSTLDRHSDAADAYSRALEWYQEQLQEFSAESMTLDHLKAHRRVCEATVLIAEELLFCPAGEDIVTSETQSLIVKASERVDYITGYYDRARDSLQDTLFFMANLAALGTDVEIEKEEICHLSTMIMGVGVGLAENQEEEAEDSATEPAKKKAKT
jgi:tetratricopeptide (TPR) repeat protein